MVAWLGDIRPWARPQAADRLDALGVIGILRSTACAQYMSARTSGLLYEPTDPLALSGRSLNDKQAMLDHIDCKLIHLAAGMHTRSAQVEAGIRQQAMLDLRAQLGAELYVTWLQASHSKAIFSILTAPWLTVRRRLWPVYAIPQLRYRCHSVQMMRPCGK